MYIGGSGYKWRPLINIIFLVYIPPIDGRVFCTREHHDIAKFLTDVVLIFLLLPDHHVHIWFWVCSLLIPLHIECPTCCNCEGQQGGSNTELLAGASHVAGTENYVDLKKQLRPRLLNRDRKCKFQFL